MLKTATILVYFLIKIDEFIRLNIRNNHTEMKSEKFPFTVNSNNFNEFLRIYLRKYQDNKQKERSFSFSILRNHFLSSTICSK